MNKHKYYNNKFRNLGFLRFRQTVFMIDVDQADMKLAKQIFSEIAHDTDITLTENSISTIKQLDFLPTIGVKIKEPLLVMTIDFVLKDISSQLGMTSYNYGEK